MSKSPYAIKYPFIQTDYLLGPQCLNVPALIPHIPVIIISTIFFQCSYTLLGPFLHYLFKPSNPKSPYTKLSRHFYNINIVSITQSCVNTAIGIYLLAHPEFRDGLTAQERVFGYHEQTARLLAISTGYFVFHLGQTWVHRDIHGMIMFTHAVSILAAIMLGFVSSCLELFLLK
jgi:hypothetical protein